jgi:hypothetical protein
MISEVAHVISEHSEQASCFSLNFESHKGSSSLIRTPPERAFGNLRTPRHIYRNPDWSLKPKGSTALPSGRFSSHERAWSETRRCSLQGALALPSLSSFSATALVERFDIEPYSDFQAKWSNFIGSFSAVSTPNFASKYSLESSWRDLQEIHVFAPLRPKYFKKNRQFFSHFSAIF